MDRHPGGSELTKRLLSLSPLAPCRMVDLGAGKGESLALLRRLGYEAVGIDLCPGPGVLAGDFLHPPFAPGSFGAALSQCAFYVSGDQAGAFCSAHRLLAPGGTLYVADVFFGPKEGFVDLAVQAGFRVLACEDHTAAWREYYLRLVWEGRAGDFCRPHPRGGCGYFLMACQKE